jgi:hypothetical protein
MQFRILSSRLYSENVKCCKQRKLQFYTGADGMTMLKFRKRVGARGLDSYGAGYGPVVGSFEHLRVAEKAENILTSCTTISFSRWTLLHEVGLFLSQKEQQSHLNLLHLNDHQYKCLLRHLLAR